MSNELKPKDVIRALECCGNQSWCYGSKCPYYGIRRDCLQVLQQDALALLREKDAEIADARAEAIDVFLTRAIARSQERGDLKPFVLVEDLYDIAKTIKEERHDRQSNTNY